MLNENWLGAKRLWLDEQGTRPHAFMAVRQKFSLAAARKDLTLRICADSDFIAYIDGVEIGRGQFSDDPEFQTWSDFDKIDLAAGEHLLAVSVYHKGYNCAVYAAGKPGVIYTLLDNNTAVLVSDESAKVVPTPGFLSGEVPLLTPQLGYTMEFDSRANDGSWYTQADFDDSSWQQPYAEVLTGDFGARPAAAWPKLTEFVPGKRIKSGMILRHNEGDTVALTMSNDQVFFDTVLLDGVMQRKYPKVGDGWCLIYDLGCETVGFMEFTIDAPAGTVVDIAHGEHLDDNQVRMACFGRNFADRYICRGGGETFQFPFRRVGARFLEFHITLAEGLEPVTLSNVGVRKWELPLPPAAEFNAADTQLTEVRKLAIRTLELCMHEHYEDCPWREQALYTYDSRNQMLYGYYLWGNWEFAAASLNLISTGLLPDGHLRICNPTRLKLVIPTFSLVWARQIKEHYLYSGDSSVYLRNRDKLITMSEKLLADPEPRTGLYQALSEDHWSFYEWTDGMNRYSNTADDVHILYNLYMVGMLQSLSDLESALGDAALAEKWAKQAQDIRDKVEKIFYDPADGLYASYWSNGKLADFRNEHVQIMMLHENAVPAEKIPHVVEKIIQGGNIIPITLSVMPYLMEALLLGDAGEAARKFMRRKLEENYYLMLDGKSTTLWETIKGGDDFVYAGSLCHGWSSLPVYYCGAGLLGVVPLEPGFKRFRVRPWDDGRDFASGAIPTTAGPIWVEWKKNAQGKLDLTVKHPAGLTPEIAELPESPLGRVEVIEI